MKFWDWNHIKAEEAGAALRRRSFDIENLAVSLIELRAGTNLPVAAHAGEQVILVLRGALHLWVRGEEVALGANQMLSVPAGWGFRAVTKQDSSIVAIRVPKAAAAPTEVDEHERRVDRESGEGASDSQDPDQYLWAV
jgi:quercetin dioxygenase-like cupin family protein